MKEGHSYPVDIWCLGCCCLEMLTGRPPWTDRTTKRNKVLNIIAKTDDYPNYPSSISDECYDFIFNCCIKRDPKERWAVKDLLDHPFICKDTEKPLYTGKKMKDLLTSNRVSLGVK